MFWTQQANIIPGYKNIIVVWILNGNCTFFSTGSFDRRGGRGWSDFHTVKVDIIKKHWQKQIQRKPTFHCPQTGHPEQWCCSFDKRGRIDYTCEQFWCSWLHPHIEWDQHPHLAYWRYIRKIWAFQQKESSLLVIRGNSNKFFLFRINNGFRSDGLFTWTASGHWRK